MYDKTALTVGRLYDDTNSLKQYNAQMLTLVRKEYYKKSIDFHGYERFVNILTCMNLHIDEMKIKLNDFVDKNGQPGMKIDVIA